MANRWIESNGTDMESAAEINRAMEQNQGLKVYCSSN